MSSNNTSRSSTARSERNEQNSELRETTRNDGETENFQDSTFSTDQMETDRTSALIKPGEELQVPENNENENDSSSSPVGIQRLAMFNPLARRSSNEEQNDDSNKTRRSSNASRKSTSPRENSARNEVSSRHESQTSPVETTSRRQSTTQDEQIQKPISRKGSQSSFNQATPTEQDEKPISRKTSQASLVKNNSRRESTTSKQELQQDEKPISRKASQSSFVKNSSRPESTISKQEVEQDEKPISRKASQASFVKTGSRRESTTSKQEVEQEEKPISRKASQASFVKTGSRRESTTSKQEAEPEDKPISRKPSQASFVNNNSRRESTTSKQEVEQEDKPISRKPSQSSFVQNSSRRESTSSKQEVEQNEKPISRKPSQSSFVKSSSRRESTTSKQVVEQDEKPISRKASQASLVKKSSRSQSPTAEQDFEERQAPMSRKASQASVYSKKSRTQDENEDNEETKSRDPSPASRKSSRKTSPTARTKSRHDFYEDATGLGSNSSTARENSSSAMKAAASSRRSSKKSDVEAVRDRVSSRLDQSNKTPVDSENENSPRRKQPIELPALDLDDLTNGQTTKSPASSRSSSAHSEPEIKTTEKARKLSDASTATEKNWAKTDNQKQTDRSRPSLARSSSNESLSDIPIVDDQSLESNSVSNTDDETVRRPVHRSRKDLMESNTNPVIDDNLSKRNRTPPTNGRQIPKVTQTRSDDENLQDEAKNLVEKHKKPKKQIEKNDDQRQALSDTEHILTETQKKRRRPKRISRTCQTDERIFRRLAREAGKELRPSADTEKNTQTRKSQLRSRTRSPKRALPVYLSTDAFRIEEILPKQFPQTSETVSRTALIAQSPLPQGGKLLILRPTLPLYHSDAVGTRRICLQYAIDLVPNSNSASKINETERSELSRTFPAIRSSSVAEGRSPNDAKSNSINRNQQKDKAANHRLDFRPNPSRPNQSRPNNRPV